MIKKNLICVLISFVVMVLLPLLTVTFVKGDSGMAICFILFFVINPITSIGIGIFAGRNIKTLWFQPLLLALLFIAGVWLLFDMGEMAFLMYAGIYLIIGILTMVIVSFIQQKNKSK